MPTCEVQRCGAADIFDDPLHVGLFAEYERECANALLGPTAPNRQMYEALEQYGAAQCFKALADGGLCGFAFVLISPVCHFAVRFATSESLFVSEVHRAGGLGITLMLAVKAHAKESGCASLFLSAPVNSKLARMLFLYAGKNDSDIRHTNHIFCWSL